MDVFIPRLQTSIDVCFGFISYIISDIYGLIVVSDDVRSYSNVHLHGNSGVRSFYKGAQSARKFGPKTECVVLQEAVRAPDKQSKFGF